MYVNIFFFKQKTAYEMRISDWSSDVCSSDLRRSPSLQYCVKTKFAGYALVTRACESPGEPAPKDLDALRFPAQMAIERRRIVAVADHQLDLRAALPAQPVARRVEQPERKAFAAPRGGDAQIIDPAAMPVEARHPRSEEHTSELQ